MGKIHALVAMKGHWRTGTGCCSKETVMEKRYVLFDLDGTLTDSYEGIINALRFSLNKFNVEPKPDTFRKIIGPPVVWSLKKFYGFDDETAEKAYLEFESLNGKYPANEERLWEDAETIKKRVMAVLEKYSKYEKVVIACHGMMIQATTGVDLPKNGQIVEFDLFTK